MFTAYVKQQSNNALYPASALALMLVLAAALALAKFKFNVKVLYVMDKALTGELSCPCDRSCMLMCHKNLISHSLIASSILYHEFFKKYDFFLDFCYLGTSHRCFKCLISMENERFHHRNTEILNSNLKEIGYPNT